MDQEHYSDAYGFTRPPDEIMAEKAIKANPHMPPWLFQKSDDLQIEVLHALDTGELVWIKDPKQRKGPLAPKQAKQERNWTSIGCGAVLFVVWTLGALFAAFSNPQEVTGLWWFIRLGWLFFAWGLPIQFLREQSQK
jgi:hypothetical protein